MDITRRCAAISLTILVAGLCSLPAGAQQPKRGGTLVVGSLQAPRHLNGAVQSGIATAMPSTQLFASPLRFDSKWNPQPYLAESWRLAEDGLSLTLNLRKDAIFHDGRPVTSADVAFSIMAIKANHPFTSMLAPVEKVDTPNAHTAIIRMSAPHPAIVLAMSPALCPILPKHIYGDGQDLKSHPRNSTNVIGSGPFKLVDFTPGRRVVLERFDKFFLPGKPYLDKVVMDISSDTASMMLSLERGDIQMLPFISNPVDLRRVSGNGQLALTEKGYEGIGPLNLLEFNLERKPLSDPRVRKAIATAIDKDFITRALMGGFAKRSDGPIVPTSPLATMDLVRYPFNVKKAAAMLDDAGYKVGDGGERFVLTLDYEPGFDDQQKNVAEYVRGQLKKIGIGVDLRSSADLPAWAARMAAHDFDMTMDTLFNWGDPVIGVHRTYLSTNIKPIVWTNTTSYRNARVDELLKAAGGELEAAKRKSYYAEFQKIITEELPINFINVIPYHTAASKKIGNVPVSIWGPMSPYDEVYFR